MGIHSKKSLEIALSKLRSFEKPSFQLEQYATPSNIAAEWVWTMALKGEVAGKSFLDAACGPGILGIGLLLMGAKKVFFVDKDIEIMHICQMNYQEIENEYEIGLAEFVTGDIRLFDGEVDIVVQNPPFGTKNEHIDKLFLEKAFSLAKIVYSMHKFSTKIFVEAISQDYGYIITDVWRFNFPIKAMFHFHKKPVREIDVGLWRMEKRV
ncbi:RsmD family RNA methyltransferase [Candidatus Woesearchaeota archaeon]|nr:RsmD family RNA methyltransferase [Candidatus Woesearchaeota archaeon]